jgi:hypothetical protein
MKIDMCGNMLYLCTLERDHNGNNDLWAALRFSPFLPHGVQIFIVTVVAAALMKCKELLLRFAWLSEQNFVKTSALLTSLLLHTIIDRFVGHLITRRWEDSIKMYLRSVVF